MLSADQDPIDKKCHSICDFLAGWPAKGMPRKVMDVGYFAQTKGVVGCHYRRDLVFKVRDLDRLLIWNPASFL
jgi:hypothetical protein